MYTGNTSSWHAEHAQAPVYPCVYREHVEFLADACMIPVYPCVYREHLYSIDSSLSKNGLSLCIQGTQMVLVVSICYTRFIPVYTGNTKAATLTIPLGAVYPCVYREHCIAAFIKIYRTGLSLCIQGTHRQIPN